MSAENASSPTEQDEFGNLVNNSGVADNSAEVFANNAANNSAEVPANNMANTAANNMANNAANNSADVPSNNMANNMANNSAEVPANNMANNSAEVPANNNAANNSAEVPANNAEAELAASMNQGENIAVPALPTKKPMSATAKSVLDDRMKTFEDLKAAYANTFGNAPKAPKAKAYEAFALHKIRKEQGENAFQAKMQEYIDRNQGKFASMPTKKTKKVSFPNVSAANNSTQKKSVGASMKAMGESVKKLVDSMISLAQTNSGEVSKKHRKTRSNKGKTHRRSQKAMNA
jgi:DNA-binding cell septation regulator SpoVG